MNNSMFNDVVIGRHVIAVLCTVVIDDGLVKSHHAVSKASQNVIHEGQRCPSCSAHVAALVARLHEPRLRTDGRPPAARGSCGFSLNRALAINVVNFKHPQQAYCRRAHRGSCPPYHCRRLQRDSADSCGSCICRLWQNWTGSCCSESFYPVGAAAGDGAAVDGAAVEGAAAQSPAPVGSLPEHLL